MSILWKKKLEESLQLCVKRALDGRFTASYPFHDTL